MCLSLKSIGFDVHVRIFSHISSQTGLLASDLGSCDDDWVCDKEIHPWCQGTRADTIYLVFQGVWRA